MNWNPNSVFVHVGFLLFAIISSSSAQRDSPGDFKDNDDFDLGRPCGVCPVEYNPYCGSDGRTYNNACYFLCAQNRSPELRLMYQGTCRPATSCPCDRSSQPVCGSNGISYANPCILECAKKTYPRNLTVQS